MQLLKRMPDTVEAHHMTVMFNPHPSFIDKETEARKGLIIFPMPYRQ